MAGRCRIEHDVVVFPHQADVSQQGGELVKGGDLCGAGAGELLFNTAHHAVWQLATHRADDPFPIGLRGRLRVYLQCRQSADCRYGGHLVAYLSIKDLTYV